jgi:hypothetical protein
MIEVQDRWFANRLKKIGGKSRSFPTGKKVAERLDLSIGSQCSHGFATTNRKEKIMAEFTPGHLTVSAEMYLDHPAEAIWPLLCPVREYDWIETWTCELLHSESGVNEPGCVFRTDFPGEGPEVWLTSRFEPCGRLEFVRTGPDRIIHFVIGLASDDDATRLTWTHHVTALTERGNGYLRAKPEAFAAQTALLERMLGHYLDSGEMLK